MNKMKILIKLTPLEPYFLGGERIFDIVSKEEGGKKSLEENKYYFIRSLDTPSQTTLFGVLRYLGIKDPSKGNYLDDEDKNNIGSNSFNLIPNDSSGFGRINSISPLHLYYDGKYLLPTPFDHKCGQENGESNEAEKYSYFDDYSDPIATSHGEKILPKDYNAKVGLANSWFTIDDNEIHSDIIKGVVRTGINKNRTDKAFFKKEYKCLKKGYSFTFTADIEEGYDFLFTKDDDSDVSRLNKRTVYLGQGKSPFFAQVSLMKKELPTLDPKSLRKGMVYAQSDLYYAGDIQTLYNDCKFVCVKTRDFRIFTTNYGKKSSKDRFIKGNNIQLIRAGSMFWPNDIESFKSKITNQHAAIAGFNQIIIGGETQ